MAPGSCRGPPEQGRQHPNNLTWPVFLSFAPTPLKTAQPTLSQAAQLAAWDKVVGRIAEKDKFFAKVIESQKKYAKEVMGYLNLNQPDYKLAYKHYFG